MSKTLSVTPNEWSALSNLLDEGLSLEPSERERWVDTRPGLTDSQRAWLVRLLNDASTPTSNQGVLGRLEAWVSSVRTSSTPTKSEALAEIFHAQQIVGPYQLVRRLGRGGMSEVWCAHRHDGAFDYEVALKLPRLDYSADAAARLSREARILAKLNHPNIARLYDAGVALGGQPYLAMELIEGQNIMAFAKERKLSLPERAKLVAQVLSALQYAHQHLVVHRDLKPGNIWVRPDGRVALLDFGISKLLNSPKAAPNESAVTREFGTAFTPAYAAPEQLGGEPMGTGADIFSIGVLLYELCGGRRPFAHAEQSIGNLLNAIRTNPPTRLVADSHNDAPPLIEQAKSHGCSNAATWQRAFEGDPLAIARKALRFAPQDRYISASAMLDDVEATVAGRPISVRLHDTVYRASRFIRRHRLPLALAGLVFAALTFATLRVVEERALSRQSVQAATQTRSMLRGMILGLGPEQGPIQKRLVDSASLSLLAANDPDPERTRLWLAELYVEAEACGEAHKLAEPIRASAQTRGDFAREADALSIIADCKISLDQSVEVEPLLSDYFVRYGREPSPVGRADLTSVAKIELRMGLSLRSRQHYDQLAATQMLKSAIEHLPFADPQRVQPELLANALQELATIARQRGDLGEASQLLDRAQSSLRDGQNTATRLSLEVDRVRLMARRGGYQEAAVASATLQRELENLMPADSALVATVRQDRLTSLMRSGQLDQAEKEVAELETLYSQRPHLQRLRHNLEIIAMTLAQVRGDDAKVESRLRGWLTEPANQKPSLRRAEWQRMLGISVLKQGHTTEAIVELERAIELYRVSGEGLTAAGPNFARVMLGCAYLRLGEDRLAATELSESHAVLLKLLGPDNQGVQIAQAYLALVPNSALSGAPQREAIAAAVRKNLAWQLGAPTLADLIRQGFSSEHRSAIPVLH